GEAGNDSGGGGANPPSGDASVITGDATAGSNVVNQVNTNTLNSDLDIVAENSASSTEDIDLRDEVGEFASSTKNGTGESGEGDACDGGERCHDRDRGRVSLENENSATTTNVILVSAETGRNTASTACGDASITTGNAAAGANLVNFVNTNLVNSNLLLVTINKLGDWFGDLVLPNKQFFENFFASLHPSPAPVRSVENNNQATVTNEVEVAAGTGSNAAHAADGGASITSGPAYAIANILNFINTNIISSGGVSFSIIINFGGGWDGSVFSLPEGASVTMNGGQLAIEYECGSPPSPLAESDDAQDQTRSRLRRSLDVSNENTAVIENKVIVLAETGANIAESAACGAAAIATGQAAAAANVVNFANTNIIGKNWFLAMINIAGDWFGDVAFGRPDLWLGEKAELPSDPVGLGGVFTYELTLANRGDADATGVSLTDVFDARYLEVVDPGGGTLTASGTIAWDLGSLPIGASTEHSYTVRVRELPEGSTDIVNISEAAAREPDANPEDNTESLIVNA
ncbi:MAG: hypothetical protein AAB650_00620, partial [Patescibacteria group bacterium]